MCIVVSPGAKALLLLFFPGYLLRCLSSVFHFSWVCFVGAVVAAVLVLSLSRFGVCCGS